MESKYPTLGLSDTIKFGRFNGQQVGNIIVENPTYLMWLREQRWKAEPSNRQAGLEDDVHILLDEVWETLPLSQQFKFSRWDKFTKKSEPEPVAANDDSINVDDLLPSKAERVKGWGSW